MIHQTETTALNSPTVKDIIAILKTYPKEAEFLTTEGKAPTQITIDEKANKVYFGEYKDIKLNTADYGRNI